MARKRVNHIGPWQPSADELRVIEYLAVGYSQNRTAALTGVHQQVISRWYNQNEAFRQMVADRTVEFIESQSNVFEQTKALAQLIFHQAMTGERDRDDPATELAVKFLDRTVWRLASGEKHQQFGAQRQLPPGDDTA